MDSERVALYPEGDANMAPIEADRRWLDISSVYHFDQRRQRLAKIELMRRRHGPRHVHCSNMALYQTTPRLDVIQMSPAPLD